MIWIVAIVGLILWERSQSQVAAPGMDAAPAQGDPALSAGQPITSGQSYTQSLAAATDPGAPFATTTAPVSVPGNAPVRGPTFWGVGYHSVASQASAVFSIPPSLFAVKQASSGTAIPSSIFARSAAPAATPATGLKGHLLGGVK